MQLNCLQVTNFRNYKAETLVLNPRCNVIYGQNAQGKTNLLEAIVYLSTGKSPRTRFDKEMIRFDESFAQIKGDVNTRDRDFVVHIELNHGKRRKMWVNDVPCKQAGELSAVFQTVYFCPEDLQLIRAGGSERRRFLDQALCQLRPRYASALAEYNRLHDHKTRILRDSDEKPQLLELLPEFNSQMVHFGAIVIHYRAHFIDKLSHIAAVNHMECSGGTERLDLHYDTVSTVENPLADVETIKKQLFHHMEIHQTAERKVRLCLSGPHKDDLTVHINGQVAKKYSSQGQTRTAALSLKLAERSLYQNTTGEFPLLLLDDVLSELDPQRQEFVLNRIQDGQVFITCCENHRLETLLDGKVFHVDCGRVLG
ncbi:DNA replication/repair protein RecF [Bengtsoniella intestinalis]|uniref:DNA replication/repair protein RecF n=1 Tax=Bengtsoniella intestinalis TaxID=3073143 RepID=UPI00391F32B5